jgi:hypothetical protein
MNTRRAPSSAIAKAAAIAVLLNRQKPIARPGSAWCPEGRTPQKPRADHQSASHCTRPTRGVQRGAIGGLADEGVGVDRAAAGQRQLPDPLDMTGAVDELQLRLIGRRGLASLPAQPVARGQRTLEHFQALGRVRMLGGMRSGVVFKTGWMVEVQPRLSG